MRRAILIAMGLAMFVAVPSGFADDETKRAVVGVVSGLLGVPQQSTEATYTTEQKDRLVSLLLSGQYVTTRQGEPVDLMVYGVPLTKPEHVYTARPIPTAEQRQ